MNLNEFSYIWEKEKSDWVLVSTEYGYSVVNRRTQMSLLVSDDILEKTIINRMLKEGNQIYASITDAYSDI